MLNLMWGALHNTRGHSETFYIFKLSFNLFPNLWQFECVAQAARCSLMKWRCAIPEAFENE
jgi:hypothetical protein